MRSLSWIIFGLISLIILLGSAQQLAPVLPLYTDAALRLRVQEIISLTAEQKGLLLSGIKIQQVSHDTVTLRYREYLRGADTVTCYSVSLITPVTTAIPCIND